MNAHPISSRSSLQLELSEDRWISDLSMHGEIRSFEVLNFVTKSKSDHHLIEIVDLVKHGRALFLNQCARVFERDEFIYHEMLVHPALNMCNINREPVNILIIGDGDGGGIRELLKYKNVNIQWVELDEVVVSVCVEHLGLINEETFNDQRLNLKISDGFEFLSNCKESFDVIILTITEPDQCPKSEPLYKFELYPVVKQLLTKDGVFVRSLCPLTSANSFEFKGHLKAVGQHFDSVLPYSTALPEFGIDWGFLMASECNQFTTTWENLPNDVKIFSPELFNSATFRPQYSRI